MKLSLILKLIKIIKITKHKKKKTKFYENNKINDA